MNSETHHMNRSDFHQDSATPHTIPADLSNLLREFTISILVERPDDLLDYAVNYFTEHKRQRDEVLATLVRTEDSIGETVQTEASESIETTSQRSQSVIKLPEKVRKESSLDMEVAILEPEKLTSKTMEERKKLRKLLLQTYIFRDLEEDALSAIIKDMQRHVVYAGKIIIQQDDEGTDVYVIESGTFEAYTTNEDDNQNLIVAEYVDKGAFGELGPMLNRNRCLSVKAVTCGIVWHADCREFLTNASVKRSMYESFLHDIPELSPLSWYQKIEMCYALISVDADAGEIIGHEGDQPQGIYFVVMGAVDVTWRKHGILKGSKIFPKGFFGGKELVCGIPYNMTTKASTKVNLAFLDITDFNELLAPCVQSFERHHM